MKKDSSAYFFGTHSSLTWDSLMPEFSHHLDYVSLLWLTRALAKIAWHLVYSLIWDFQNMTFSWRIFGRNFSYAPKLSIMSLQKWLHAGKEHTCHFFFHNFGCKKANPIGFIAQPDACLPSHFRRSVELFAINWKCNNNVIIKQQVVAFSWEILTPFFIQPQQRKHFFLPRENGHQKEPHCLQFSHAECTYFEPLATY